MAGYPVGEPYEHGMLDAGNGHEIFWMVSGTPTGRPLDGARHLADAAVAEGWSVDGAPGFVYTVDWGGNPRVRQRLHWVLCEALGAATALWSVTGEAAYRDLYATWWDYTDRYLIDRADGSWHHELEVANRPAETIKPGKAGVYHALQATLLPRLELGPALASSLVVGR